MGITDGVARLAALILDGGLSDEFRGQAVKLAASISEEDITDLERLFHDPPPEPDTYDFRKHGLGGWISACQFAAFELLYNLGEPALPFLRKVAWGPYDWTQGNAIEIMIRLAARGIATEAIVEDVKRRFPDIRYEAQLYALEPLMPLLDTDETLADLFDRLKHCVAFAETYAELAEDL